VTLVTANVLVDNIKKYCIYRVLNSFDLSDVTSILAIDYYVVQCLLMSRNAHTSSDIPGTVQDTIGDIIIQKTPNVSANIALFVSEPK